QARFALAREAIEAYYTGASEDVLLKQAELKSLRAKLLGSALEFYRKLQATLEEGREARPRERGELAAAYARVGSITADIGPRDEAPGAHERARATREALARAPPAVPSSRSDLAGSLHKIGVLSRETSRPDEAQRALREAIALREALARERPDVADYRA